MTSIRALRHLLPRIVTAVLAACCAALGLMASPAAAAPAAADCSSPLQCLTFKSVSNGRQLDVQNGSSGDGALIVTNSGPGYHQNWRLNVDPSDASVTIVNNDTGKCLDTGWPAMRQQTCRGQASQKWYLQPVGSAKDTFLIRHETDNVCLDLMAGAQYDDAWVGQSVCHGRANQQWTTTPAAWNLAVDHAAKRCQKDTSSCTWRVKSEAPAAPLPKVCVSSVWYNNTGDTIQQTFAVTETTGWSSQLTNTLSASVTGGPQEALQATIQSQLSFTNIWEGSKAVNNSVTVPVPAKNYGWVTLSELARKVTGTWTFDARGFAWTAEDTVTVPVKDDPAGGATLYVANTSPSFSTCA
ncbi:RICIN domain-containing protein [Streptomyces gamaensis]|uniref:RICIN domain-containing protein n=1 Tax=Streptomyces gamaensis TaxID=1763542 RepID=A0ABW0YTE8_9ACTN